MVATYTVTSLADSGPGSFRSAINAANSDHSGTQINIRFAVGGSILLASDLPVIRRDIIIDGTSAPGYHSGGAPLVQISCNGHAGFLFAPGSDGSKLIGLSIGGASGNGVTLQASRITISSNYIGISRNGQPFGNAADGIYVAPASSGNSIGSNPSKVSGSVSNVISGNGGNGISLHGSSGNTVASNRIGTSPSGTLSIGNGANGILITDGSHTNEIGGTAFRDSITGVRNNPTGSGGHGRATFVIPPLGNLISGNERDGVLIDANSKYNTLSGNFIGTSANGTSALGNSANGITILNADDNALIGGSLRTQPFAYYNVISGNGGNGLQVTNSDNITVQSNFFGIGADNSSIVGNALDGILIDGTSRDTTVGGVYPLGNVTSGNGMNGVDVRGSVHGFTSFNTISGLLAFRSTAAPNGNDGLLITAAGHEQTVESGTFSANGNNGIEIGGDASDVTIDHVIAGLDQTGRHAEPNTDDGLKIDGTAHGNTIGGSHAAVLDPNVFSGNQGYGVDLTGHAHGNRLLASYVGLGLNGTTAIPNQLGGILVGGTANHNIIGGVASRNGPAVGGFISGNSGNGITLQSGTSYTSILNNFIGFDRHGAGRPNSGTPIEVNRSTHNHIRGNKIFCFALGTMIMTSNGEAPIETLRPGEMICTINGSPWKELTWVGRRMIDCTRHPAPESVRPIRIVAGAFAENCPSRDVLLSPDHAIYIDNVLIPVRYLIDGRCVVPAMVERVVYYHLELTDHSVVLADGLPAETYLDIGDRNNFHDSGSWVPLFPDFSDRIRSTALIQEARSCAEYIVQGPILETARRKLIARADLLEHQRRDLPAYGTSRRNQRARGTTSIAERG
jgi:parallel beta-helix repeat protein